MFNNTLPYIVSVTAIHLVLLFFDHFFKSCLFLPYINLLKTSGIKIQPFRVSWFTTSFNRYFSKFGTYRPKYQSVWFGIGTWIALCTLPFAIFFLIQSLYALFLNWAWRSYQVYKVSPFLEPALPGVNMPLSDLGYYIITLLICTVYHEVGHALAAVREGVHIAGVGIFIFFLVPVCYIKLENIDVLNVQNQLKVCCAGIWHNIVLSIFAVLLSLSIPWILFPFYDYGNGVQIIQVMKDSPLYGPGGLKEGNIVTGINRCVVSNQNSWVNCIKQAMHTPVSGFCLTSEFVHEHDESISVKISAAGNAECCRNVSSQLCFEHLEEGGDPIEIPQYSCLLARSVVQAAQVTCSSERDCSNSFCLRPSLENNTKLVEITRRRPSDASLFLGQPFEIYQNVEITEFVKVGLLPTAIPEIIRKFCEFIIMISSALAILNIIPCFYLDGYMIIRILVDILLSKYVKLKSVRLAITLSITIVATFLLVLYSTFAFLFMLNK